MQIAARNAFTTGGGGWVNPYVTDGLIAMWDGIWNIGGGMAHNPNSLVWWDCIGGMPICSIWSGTIFASDGLSIGGGASGLFGGAYGSYAMSDYGFRSMEIVLRPSSSQSSCVICIGGRNVTIKSEVAGIGFSNAGFYYTRPGLDLTGASSAYAYCDYGDMLLSNTEYVIIDGQTTTAAGWDTWGGNAGVGYGRIKSSYTTGNSYSFTGKIHAVRLYSRALTADEVAANYAIDKARFNLP